MVNNPVMMQTNTTSTGVSVQRITVNKDEATGGFTIPIPSSITGKVIAALFYRLAPSVPDSPTYYEGWIYKVSNGATQAHISGVSANSAGHYTLNPSYAFITDTNINIDTGGDGYFASGNWSVWLLYTE